MSDRAIVRWRASDRAIVRWRASDRRGPRGWSVRVEGSTLHVWGASGPGLMVVCCSPGAFAEWCERLALLRYQT